MRLIFLLERFVVKNEITCLKIHPNEDCIATGTVSGKIILWYLEVNSSKINTFMYIMISISRLQGMVF
jgi:hypothetical protein